MARSLDEKQSKNPLVRCPSCYHENPGERFRHWANFPNEDLLPHLLNQFGDEQHSWALREIEYIRGERSRLYDDWRKHLQRRWLPNTFRRLLRDDL